MSVMESGSDRPAGGQAGAPAEGGADARVRLANERTYLAWGRTSLAFFALALAVGRIVPGLERSASRWPFEVIGCAYAGLGVAFALYGLYRHRAVQHAVLTGGSVEASGPLLAVLSGLTAMLGVATFVVMIAD
jgi:putative membrane protein